jgi:REP element-mobilizing transposase RayT
MRLADGNEMNRYNPDTHHRRSIRLKNYDYSRKGAYFLTLCTFDRGCHFERFTQLRQIVETQWHRLPERFPGVVLDEFVIMPNHFHGIIVFCGDTPRGYPGSAPLQSGSPQNLIPAETGHPQGALLRGPTVGDVVGAFKSLCVNAWLKVIRSEGTNATGKFWQNNYYEHVIRDQGEMDRIRRYIAENPLRWEFDRENPGFSKKQGPQDERWMV